VNEYMILTADHEVVSTDLRTWSKAFGNTKAFEKARRVGKTTVGDAEVSTVFLGINHEFMGGPPLWFETMVFGGDYDADQWRYTTWAEAEAGHARVVAALERGEDHG
jgi:hypothetical protein